MRISKSQAIVLLITVAIIGSLTYMGFKTSRVSQNDAASVVVINNSLETLTEEEESSLPDSLKSMVRANGHDPAVLKHLINGMDSLGKRLVSAHLMEQLADQDPNESNWMIAGSKYYSIAVMSNDTNLFKDAGSHARDAFEKALQLNPHSLDAKNALASCYVDIDKDIMKGVGLLKQVVATDSNNVQALFTLGMLSMQSGQWDKAKQRFERLTELQPFNPEYYYYVGEVYAKSGDTKAAIDSYEKCKTLLKDKAAQKEIQTLIDKLKSI